jgi:hypothetical protein
LKNSLPSAPFATADVALFAGPAGTGQIPEFKYLPVSGGKEHVALSNRIW